MDAPYEQRRYPRVRPPRHVVVAWQSGIKREVSRVDNLGLGGLFLRTKQTLPPSSLVELILDLPLGQVRGRALVRRALADQGMGVQIVAMGQEDRGRLVRQIREFGKPV
jgi:PilZ domain